VHPLKFKYSGSESAAFQKFAITDKTWRRGVFFDDIDRRKVPGTRTATAWIFGNPPIVNPDFFGFIQFFVSHKLRILLIPGATPMSEIAITPCFAASSSFKDLPGKCNINDITSS
jgi:hypothetical protein